MRLERRACRRAHSEPARRSTPWKNGLFTWLRRPAQLRELRGRHAPSPFYPATRVSRRSQARLSERARRHVSAEPALLQSANSYGQRETCCGSEPCERRVARARREKHVVGENAGQVTDLAGSHPRIPETCFPAPSSGSPSSMSPAAPSPRQRNDRTAGVDMRPN